VAIAPIVPMMVPTGVVGAGTLVGVVADVLVGVDVDTLVRVDVDTLVGVGAGRWEE
jgi:hypothetical protein